MSKKINPVNGVEIDPMFDGHLEKPLSKMTPKEKLQYLWMQMEFKWWIKDRVFVEKDNRDSQDSQDKPGFVRLSRLPGSVRRDN